jgi:hypothetical protein
VFLFTLLFQKVNPLMKGAGPVNPNFQKLPRIGNSGTDNRPNRVSIGKVYEFKHGTAVAV